MGGPGGLGVGVGQATWGARATGIPRYFLLLSLPSYRNVKVPLGTTTSAGGRGLPGKV